MSRNGLSPPFKLPNRQLLIRLALAVIAAVIACNIPHSLISMFKESVSQATPPPEIQNVLAGGGYVWLLQCYLSALYPDRQIEILNAGISGNKATDMQARFQKDAIDQKPDLVMINVGVNEC
jgi:lysophospholipase L1-like esterase